MNLAEAQSQMNADLAEGKVSLEGGAAPESKQTTTPAETNTPSVTELDKMEKFLFEGKEWTPKDLKGAILRQSDYTQKTQALSEERKYYDNLPYDLMQVASNPSLVEKFKQIYPEKFHSYLDAVQSMNQSQPTGQGTQPEQKSGVDQELVSRLQTLESRLHEQDVQTAEQKISQVFDKLKGKYEYADEEQVIARAQHYLSKGEKPTDEFFEKMFKAVNDYNQQRYESWQKQKVAAQKEAHSKGKEMGGGGGVPGQAPKRMTFKEAEAAMIADLKGGGPR